MELSCLQLIDSERSWRKRVGVEPTIRPAKDRITGFEGRESHRTLFASGNSIAWVSDWRLVAGDWWKNLIRLPLWRPPVRFEFWNGATNCQERWEAIAAACWVRIKAATRS